MLLCIVPSSAKEKKTPESGFLGEPPREPGTVPISTAGKDKLSRFARRLAHTSQSVAGLQQHCLDCISS